MLEMSFEVKDPPSETSSEVEKTSLSKKMIATNIPSVSITLEVSLPDDKPKEAPVKKVRKPAVKTVKQPDMNLKLTQLKRTFTRPDLTKKPS